MLFGLSSGAALATVVVAFAVAGRIARPIVALTEFTRSYLRPGPPPAPPQGSGEVGELSRSFVRLVEDLQRSQHTLVQASKLAALGEVTALMAHEVRTPLGILRSSVQMLRNIPALALMWPQQGFLPEAQNDFIFSAFAEERGFAGVLVALGL